MLSQELLPWTRVAAHGFGRKETEAEGNREESEDFGSVRGRLAKRENQGFSG